MAKCGASRSGYTTISNAVHNDPRKETKGITDPIRDIWKV